MSVSETDQPAANKRCRQLGWAAVLAGLTSFFFLLLWQSVLCTRTFAISNRYSAVVGWLIFRPLPTLQRTSQDHPPSLRLGRTPYLVIVPDPGVYLDRPCDSLYCS